MKSSLATALLLAAAFTSPAFACGETKIQCHVVVEHEGKSFCLGEALTQDEQGGTVILNMGNNDFVVSTADGDSWYTGHAKYRCLDSPVLLLRLIQKNDLLGSEE